MNWPRLFAIVGSIVLAGAVYGQNPTIINTSTGLMLNPPGRRTGNVTVQVDPASSFWGMFASSNTVSKTSLTNTLAGVYLDLANAGPLATLADYEGLGLGMLCRSYGGGVQWVNFHEQSGVLVSPNGGDPFQIVSDVSQYESDPVAMAQGFLTSESDPVFSQSAVLAMYNDGRIVTCQGSSYGVPIENVAVTSESDPIAMSQGFITGESDPVAMAQGFLTSESDPVAMAQGFITGESDPTIHGSGDVHLTGNDFFISCDNGQMGGTIKLSPNQYSAAGSPQYAYLFLNSDNGVQLHGATTVSEGTALSMSTDNGNVSIACSGGASGGDITSSASRTNTVSGAVVVLNAGTFLITGSDLPYTPASTNYWAGTPPSTIKQALDRIAAVVGNPTPIP